MKKMAIAINFSLLSTFQDLKMFTSLKKTQLVKFSKIRKYIVF